MDLISDD